MRIRSVAVASLSCALLLGTMVPASAQDDPYQLLTQAVHATSSTSFHLLVTANGTVNLGEMMDNTPISIDGTQAEGDITVNPVGVSLTFEIPIQGLPISGGLIVPSDGSAYIKLSLPVGSVDDLWHRIPVGDLGIPMAIPSPAPGVDQAAELKTELDAAGVTLTNEGGATCAAGSCTRLHLEVPASVFESIVGSVLPRASAAPSSAPGVPIPVDILVDTATGRIDSASATLQDAATGASASVSIQLSAFDQPVTIAAPPADQVTDEPLLGGAFDS